MQKSSLRANDEYGLSVTRELEFLRLAVGLGSVISGAQNLKLPYF